MLLNFPSFPFFFFLITLHARQSFFLFFFLDEKRSINSIVRKRTRFNDYDEKIFLLTNNFRFNGSSRIPFSKRARTRSFGKVASRRGRWRVIGFPYQSTPVIWNKFLIMRASRFYVRAVRPRFERDAKKPFAERTRRYSLVKLEDKIIRAKSSFTVIIFSPSLLLLDVQPEYLFHIAIGIPTVLFQGYLTFKRRIKYQDYRLSKRASISLLWFNNLII